jgi:hypothetical protein
MRTVEQRKADAFSRLENDIDVWVATADDHEIAHLVPLSLCWHNREVIVATEARSRTARNAQSSGQARLALGLTRDVVMIDAAASVIERNRTNLAIRSAYLDRTGWDPGAEGGEWVYLLLRPRTVQVWRDVEEMAGRTIMRNGSWFP